MKDTEGNINLDFLIGLVVFLVAFLYLINAIPGIFLPYQTNSIDLVSVVYRTSSILAEDPGWWVLNHSNGTDGWNWESLNNTRFTSRVGLAVDRKYPNVLSMDKINALTNMTKTSMDLSREKMGLGSTTVAYNYSLMINKTILSGETTILKIPGSDAYDMPRSGNVESLDRYITIRSGEGLLIDCSIPGEGGMGYSSNMTVSCIPRFSDANITVRFINFVSNPFETDNLTVSFYPGPYSMPISVNYSDPVNGSGYFIFKNGKYVNASDKITEGYVATDVIDVVINSTRLIQEIRKNYGEDLDLMKIELYSKSFNLPSAAYYDYNLTNPRYTYFNDPGVMHLEVWQV